MVAVVSPMSRVVCMRMCVEIDDDDEDNACGGGAGSEWWWCY